MFKKLVLIAAVAAGAYAVVPAFRERTNQELAPVRAQLRLMSQSSHWWPLLDHAFRWSAKNEARRIARSIRQGDVTDQQIPKPAEFQSWIRSNTFTGRGALDPWGFPYYLEPTKDSIVVGSAGRDHLPQTDDDVRVALAR